jgi:pre-mRNA-processing factor 8
MESNKISQNCNLTESVENLSLVDEKVFTYNNLPDLFSNIPYWIVDHSSVYRVNIYKTHEGDLTTKPINGALLIFNPKTGQLYLKVIHTSLWLGQKRLGQLAKTKSGEEVTELIKCLPKDELPEQIIVTNKLMVNPLEVSLVEFPNIQVKHSELKHIPFQACLKIDKLNDLVLNATEPQMGIFNLYDDWLNIVSGYTAFLRLVLILKALHVNHSMAKAIIFKENSVVLEQHTLPNLKDEEWVKVEIELRNLILDDYSHKTGLDAGSFSQSQIIKIILGVENIEASGLNEDLDLKE